MVLNKYFFAKNEKKRASILLLKKLSTWQIFSWCVMIISLTSCETEFTPEITTEVNDIVVEGYIEAGENARPPYVILTRAVPFFATLAVDNFNDFFVHDAIIKVSDGEEIVSLTELCLGDLSSEQKALAGEFLGIDATNLGINFCIYIDLTQSLIGELGKTYELNILAEGQELQSSTFIPAHVPLDSLRFVSPMGLALDSLVELRGSLTDIGGRADFYRFFSGRGNEPLRPSFNSVADDLFFDGQVLEIPIPRTYPDSVEFDPVTFGLFEKGDSITVKWMNIDEATFDFWNTLEFNAANQGPFSSYTKIESNIEGGLGIWGGYSVSYYNIIAP